MPTNSKAEISDRDKKILRWDEQPDFLARSVISQFPEPEMDAEMLDLWTEFLQS